MNRVAFFLAASIGLCACHSWDQGETAHILIEEEDFTPQQLADIHEAVHEWNIALDGYLAFEYVSEKGNGDLIVIRGKPLSEIEDLGFSAVTYRVPWENGGGIELPNDLSPKAEKWMLPLTLHELGHALSLEHQDGESVMNASLKSSDQRITCNDIRQFCRTNDCDAASFPICQSCDS